MPNPSTLQASLEEQYAAQCDVVNNVGNSKAVRERALRIARELANKLGIEQPPAINGRPAEPRLATITVDRELFELILAAAEAHAEDVITGYDDGIYEEPLSDELAVALKNANVLLRK